MTYFYLLSLIRDFFSCTCWMGFKMTMDYCFRIAVGYMTFLDNGNPWLLSLLSLFTYFHCFSVLAAEMYTMKFWILYLFSSYWVLAIFSVMNYCLNTSKIKQDYHLHNNSNTRKKIVHMYNSSLSKRHTRKLHFLLRSRSVNSFSF